MTVSHRSYRHHGLGAAATDRCGACVLAVSTAVATAMTKLLMPALLALALLSVTGGPTAAADTAERPVASSPEDRLTLIRTLNRQLAAGRTDSALTTCQHYLTLYPGDPGMRYNLACLEESSGHRAGAWPALTEAIADGFDDFHRITADSDLTDLITTPRFRELRAAREAELAASSRAGALVLTAGDRLRGIPLRLTSADRGEAAATVGTLDLRFDRGALEIEVTVDDPAFQAAAPPWRGGSGVFVNLVVPDSTHGFESDVAFSFAFGMFQRRTTGAVYVPGDGGRWQRVAELAPKVRIDEQRGRVHLSLLIPWRSVAPYHPLIDSELGLNVVYQGRHTDGHRLTAALIADPGFAATDHRWRRYVPLSLQPAAVTGAEIAGRLSDTVVTGGRLDLELVAWVPTAGRGNLTITFTDVAGQNVLSGAPRREQQQLDVGRNHWRREADLTALRTGPFTIKAALELPDGSVVTWHGALLRLEEDWLAATRERLPALSPAERPTVAYRIEAVARALRDRQPRQDPSPLITTVGEIGLMLRQVDTSDSILPVSGPLLMVYPGPNGEDGLCTLQLPAGHGPDTPLLVVIPEAAPTAATLARQIGQQLRSGTQLTVAVPHLPPASGGPAATERFADACLTWLRGYLNPGATLLAGVDAGAGAALKSSLTEPDALSGVLLIAGGGFDPWPQTSPAQLSSNLARHRNNLTYDWIRFTAETRRAGQADAVHDAMVTVGFQIGADEQLDGGLSLSQASGRIARWAAQR